MDGKRFDEWTRGLTGGTSRRTALRAAIGGAVAAALGVVRPSVGDAANAGGNDATCRCAFGGRKFCQSERCESDGQCCSGKCVNFNGFNEPQELGGEECRGKRCLCRFPGSRCSRDCACCSGRCVNGTCAKRQR